MGVVIGISGCQNGAMNMCSRIRLPHIFSPSPSSLGNLRDIHHATQSLKAFTLQEEVGKILSKDGTGEHAQQSTCILHPAFF